MTDLIVHDWWELILGFAGEDKPSDGTGSLVEKQIEWIKELMHETGVFALPRSKEELGRCYDCLEFWTSYSLTPIKSRI